VPVVHGVDHDLVRGVLDELVEGGVQGPGQGDELVQGQAAPAVLDTTQRGLAEVGALGQLLQGQALGDPQCADAFAYEAVQGLLFLLHTQDVMPYVQPDLTSKATGPDPTRAMQ